MTSKPDLESLLLIAENAARTAGDSLSKNRASWSVVERSMPHDLKIRADKEAEALILKELRATGLPVVSEETGQHGEWAEWGWIVDPLDGSLNYSRGLALCCVSIALVHNKVPVLGVVFDFNNQELFSGIIGSGATVNGKPIHTSKVDTLSDAILGTGFPASLMRDASDEGLIGFVKSIRTVKKIRLLGSATLSLCNVACGRFDAYREDKIMFWDVAAGCALVTAAGGTAHVSFHGGFSDPVTTIATNGILQLSPTDEK